MANYEQASVNIKKTRLNRLESRAKNKTRTTNRIRKKTKMRNGLFVNVNEAELSKTIQLGGFISKMLGNIMAHLGKKTLIDFE